MQTRFLLFRTGLNSRPLFVRYEYIFVTIKVGEFTGQLIDYTFSRMIPMYGVSHKDNNSFEDVEKFNTNQFQY
jgi:hypothetical protein